MKRKLFLVLILMLMASLVGFQVPEGIPDLTPMKPMITDYVAGLQELFKVKGPLCVNGPWYRTIGTSFYRVFQPQTCAWPVGVFFDSSEYGTLGIVHIKIVFEPVVVENYKMPGTIFPNVDGWTDDPTPGYQVKYNQFKNTPCLLLTDMLVHPTFLTLWQDALKKHFAENGQKIKDLLGDVGLNPDTGAPVSAFQSAELTERVSEISMDRELSGLVSTIGDGGIFFDQAAAQQTTVDVSARPKLESSVLTTVMLMTFVIILMVIIFIRSRGVEAY